MSELSDRQLVQLAQRGDGGAIGELFSRYWRAARAAAFAVTRDLASAEDAAAEAFGQAFAGMDSLRDPDRFGSWLRTIVVRKAHLEHQNAHPTIDALGDSLAGQNVLPDEALAQLERAALVQQAIHELPDALREAIALVYFEGYNSEVAARFLDIPTGTLRRRLHDGRARLRKSVEQILPGRKKMNEDRAREIQRLRAMIDNGGIYQPDEQTFTKAARDMQVSDVLDLNWMAAGPLELRSVQALLDCLTAAVLPEAQIRFSSYDEPRYRSALQLHIGEVSARAAYGGVLAEWPGRPAGVGAAHLRIFLEPWATLQSGQIIELDPLPEKPGVTGTARPA